jgi:hypothetical protein
VINLLALEIGTFTLPPAHEPDEYQLLLLPDWEPKKNESKFRDWLTQSQIPQNLSHGVPKMKRQRRRRQPASV